MNSKRYPTISACGIDCGLCPLHHVTAGDGCGGCTAPAPSGAKGRWCAVSRCAVRDRGYETCADCSEFPCARLDGWDERESVVTHLRTLDNLRSIRERGLTGFLEQQQKRMSMLEAMLDEFEDGRSKGYCCLAAALLPLGELEAAVREARRVVADAGIPVDDRKGRAGTLRRILDSAAERLGISLRLRTVRKG